MLMTDIIYVLTATCLAIVWLIIWFASSLSIGKMIVLLFVFDMALTIEAGIASNVELIALLHMITMPAFFSLIYLDVVGQHRSKFACFICGTDITHDEPNETVKGVINGRWGNVLVHENCVQLKDSERKAFHHKLFRKGIPE